MIIRRLALFALLISSALSVSAAIAPLSPTPEESFSTVVLTKFIKKLHYKDHALNDSESSIILDQYIDSLDPNRNVFTLGDINSFKRYRTLLDDALRKGNLDPAFNIFKRFNQRRKERAEYALKRLEQGFDFTKDEQYQFDREEAAWPKDTTELDEIWRKQIKNDVLSLQLSKKTDEEIKKTLRKRYQRYITRSTQIKAEDVYEIFINAYLKTLEPHTSYFSPRTSENFNISMRLSLEGIGAILKSDGDYTTIIKTIAGGPAELSGQIHPDDRISGVGQGEEGEIEDVVGWRIDDVVELIRGPKGSVVRLEVLPKAGGVDGPAKVITLTRDKIKLEEQRAKKSIIEIPGEGHNSRIGVITIPTFYMDFDAARRGEKDYVSTTRDTRQLIEELKAEQVDGIVINLANNGGGSLSEAISMTGLFIKSGPVVQVRNSHDQVEIDADTDESIAYDGPMAVLVNRYSASASEIFAGAMQDYGRATIVGEPTFGKGTVQQVIDLNRHISNSKTTLGQLKLTTAQFFRVNGDSTQNRGVIPDIIFPTADKDNQQGERSLKNALPWANIEAANYDRYEQTNIDLASVKAQHQKRVQSDKGFKFLLDQAETRKQITDKKTVTLNKTQRKAERDEQEAKSLALINSFRTSIGFEPKQMDELKEEADSSSKDDDKFIEEVKLIQQREAAAILADLIHPPQVDDKIMHRSTVAVSGDTL